VYSVGMTEEYSMISDTAKFPAYLRTFSKIPYAKEIYRFLVEHSSLDTQIIFGLNYDDFRWMAPLTEARQVSITNYLSTNFFDLVIELGSGFTLRWCQTSNFKYYLDTDLSQTIFLKKSMIKELKIDLPQKIFLEALNPLDVDLLEKVKALDLGVQSIAVVHEGLAQYLTKNEVIDLSKNIKKLSSEFDVQWITPDFSTVEQYLSYDDFDPKMKTLTAARKKSSGRDLMANAFDDVDTLRKFFEKIGFNTEHTYLLENSEYLSTLGDASFDQKKLVAHFYRHLRLWCLKTI
jgi:O-methyltransferase involved in polyketide biosynthesis